MKNRVIWKMFVLEIVTLGIYRLYYFIKTRKEMMDRDPSIKILTPAFLLAPLIAIFLGIVALVAIGISSAGSQPATCSSYGTYDSSYSSTTYGTSTLESPSDTVCRSNGGGAELIGIGLFYLALIVSGVLMVIWLWSYSHGVDKTTKGKLGFAITLVILVLVPDGIDILIIQDYFNKIKPHHTDAVEPPAAPQAPAAA